MLAPSLLRRDTRFMFRSALATALSALALCSAASAQTAPDGWKVEPLPGAWNATSPTSDVRLVYYPAVKSSASLVYWFDEEALRRSYAYGKQVGSQAPARASVDPEAGRLIAQSRVMLDANRAEIAVLSYAWRTPQGYQLAQIVMPIASQGGPAFDAAFAEIDRAYKSQTAYTPSEKPAGGS